MNNHLLSPKVIGREIMHQLEQYVTRLIKLGVGAKVCPLWRDEVVLVATLGDPKEEHRKYCVVFGSRWQTMSWPKECPYTYQKCPIFEGYLHGCIETEERHANAS